MHKVHFWSTFLRPDPILDGMEILVVQLPRKDWSRIRTKNTPILFNLIEQIKQHGHTVQI